MGKANFLQNAFDAGEWSQYAQGRFTHPKYRNALAVCQNMVPIETGALLRRGGFQFGNTTRGGASARLQAFSFENNNPYMMEFTDGHIRFFNGTNLLTDMASAGVTNISTATPAVVTATNFPSTWATGDNVIFAYLDYASQNLVPALSRRVFTITVLTSTTFSVADPITGASIKGTDIGWTGSPNIIVSKIIDLASPYINGDEHTVRAIQNETLMLLLHDQYAPELVQATPPTSPLSEFGTGNASFSIDPAEFIDGPYLDPFDGITASPDVTSGLVTLTLGAQLWSSTIAYDIGAYAQYNGVVYVSLIENNLNNEPDTSSSDWQVSSAGEAIGPGGFQTSDIGRHIRLFSQPPNWNPATTYAAGNIVTFDNQYWVALKSMTGASPTVGSANPNQPGLQATTWALSPASAVWTWGQIVALPTTGVINPSTGTPIGSNMNSLSDAFDGVLEKTYTACANYFSYNAALTSTIGLSFASGVAITSAKIYPSSDGKPGGFGYGHNLDAGINKNESLKFTLYASNTGLNASDKVNLGSYNGMTNSPPVTLVSNDSTTTYKYVWVELHLSGDGNSDKAQLWVSQLQLFGSGSVPAGSLVQINLIGPALLYTTAITTWQLGLYTATPDPITGEPVWPTCGCYHEGRLWLAGAVPNRFDATISNGFGQALTFSPTEADGTVTDADAISYTVDSSDLNSIYWMMPDLQGIIVGTIGGEWLINGPDTGGLTPSNIQAKRVTKYGCANIEPQRTGLTTVFVQRHLQKLLEYVADAFSGKLFAPNLAENSRHIVAEGIAQIMYQQEKDPVVWGRDALGNLFGCSYKRTSLLSSQPAELIGWHRHPLGSGRVIESMWTGPTPDGTLEALYIVSNDPETNIRHVEIMHEPFNEEDNVMTAWQLDDAIVPSAITTDSPTGSATFHGLHHLEGQTVRVYCAGLDLGDWLVVNGAITIPFGGKFTNRWLKQLDAQEQDFGSMTVPLNGSDAFPPALVGFAFTSQGQCMRPVAQDATGDRLGPAFGHFRRISRYAIMLTNAMDLKIGTDFGHLHTANFRTVGGTSVSSPSLFTGTHWDTLDDTNDLDSMVCWQSDGVFPCAVLAVGGDITTVD